ncbi:hypothetical protein LINPERHAP1_LOCUS22002 [Linum perenne]
MVLVLAGKNKFGFVNGAIPAPAPTESLFPIWTRNNQLLLSWIQRSVSPSIAQSILWMTSAREAWCELKERFSQGDAFRIADLQEHIYSFKQNNLLVSAYFTQLKALWDELANFRLIPVCDCAPTCSCVLAPIRAYHQNDFVIRFLRGLNESFATARGGVMFRLESVRVTELVRVCSNKLILFPFIFVTSVIALIKFYFPVILTSVTLALLFPCLAISTSLVHELPFPYSTFVN